MAVVYADFVASVIVGVGTFVSVGSGKSERIDFVDVEMGTGVMLEDWVVGNSVPTAGDAG
jgi:hypothetical protein